MGANQLSGNCHNFQYIPVRVWQAKQPIHHIDNAFQLTHPWGCDIIIVFNNFICIISTHTPVRVWHSWQFLMFFCRNISTHTPVRVWLFFAVMVVWETSFQLTHPWGCDYYTCAWFLTDYNFNSHTREGVTIVALVLFHGLKFQLTHPWGCDNLTSISNLTHGNFNSHTREGVTPLQSKSLTS